MPEDGVKGPVITAQGLEWVLSNEGSNDSWKTREGSW